MPLRPIFYIYLKVKVIKKKALKAEEYFKILKLKVMKTLVDI